jgi:hypothetical protein
MTAGQLFLGNDPMTIKDAWIQAATYAYTTGFAGSGVKKFAVAGDSVCMGDYLQTNNAPQGNWTYDSEKVFPMP